MRRTFQAALLCLLPIATTCRESTYSREPSQAGFPDPGSPCARLAAAEAAVARFARDDPRRYRILQPARLRHDPDSVYFIHLVHGTFDPAKPLNIPPMLRNENARDWLVQFPGLPTLGQVRQTLQPYDGPLGTYLNGATWKIRPDRDLLERLRQAKAAGRVRSLIPFHPFFKLDAPVYRWILAGKLGKEPPPTPSIHGGRPPLPHDLTPKEQMPNRRVEVLAQRDLGPILEAMGITFQYSAKNGAVVIFRPRRISEIVALARMPEVDMIFAYSQPQLLTAPSRIDTATRR